MGDPEGNGSKEALVAAIIAKLMEVLRQQVDEDDVFEAIKPLIPALVQLGVSEGVASAEEVLEGLTREDPYPYWQRLIAAANSDTRIELMERTRQTAISEIAKRMEREAAQWKALKAGINVTISILLLLLL